MANSLHLIAFVLVATATIGSCTVITPIAQARIRASGLTCSTPSPFPFWPLLSGANVSVSCFGASNTTTTDATGSFTIDVNFPQRVTGLNVLNNCRVIINVPDNCTIVFFFQRIRTLRSAGLFFEFVDNSFPGTRGVFRAPIFTNF